jgi:hypothetical protein
MYILGALVKDFLRMKWSAETETAPAQKLPNPFSSNQLSFSNHTANTANPHTGDFVCCNRELLVVTQAARMRNILSNARPGSVTFTRVYNSVNNFIKHKPRLQLFFATN